MRRCLGRADVRGEPGHAASRLGQPRALSRTPTPTRSPLPCSWATRLRISGSRSDSVDSSRARTTRTAASARKRRRRCLLRFRADVIALKPRVVVILAGTNDIAGNTGPLTNEEIQDNLASMSELAKANGIRVVLSSVLPVSAYHVANPSVVPQTTRRPSARVKALNDWMKSYAAANNARVSRLLLRHDRQHRDVEGGAQRRRPAPERRRVQGDGAARRSSHRAGASLIHALPHSQLTIAKLIGDLTFDNCQSIDNRQLEMWQCFIPSRLPRYRSLSGQNRRTRDSPSSRARTPCPAPDRSSSSRSRPCS